MAPTPRNIGTIPEADLRANEIDWSYFVRLDIGGVVGTKRFTDRRTGDVVADIDGSGSQTWLWADVLVGPLDQGRQDPLSVSWLRFANLDYVWTNWANTPGLRNVPVQVWVAWFNVSTGAKSGQYKVYDGRVDNQELGDYAQIALKPHITEWAKAAPWAVAGPLCIYPYKDPLTCQYAGAEPTGETSCGKTRANCVARGNQSRFGGADLMPKRGENIYWGVSPEGT